MVEGGVEWSFMNKAGYMWKYKLQGMILRSSLNVVFEIVRDDGCVFVQDWDLQVNLN